MEKATRETKGISIRNNKDIIISVNVDSKEDITNRIKNGQHGFGAHNAVWTITRRSKIKNIQLHC